MFRFNRLLGQAYTTGGRCRMSTASLRVYKAQQIAELKLLVAQKNNMAVAMRIQEMWKQLDEDRLIFKSRSRANPSRPQLPRMVADVLVNRHFEDQTLALETLQCLRVLNRDHYYVGLLELVDAYLDLDDLDSATECYEEILQSGDKLDQHAAERFVAKAGTKASVRHLRDVLFRHKVTFQMLVSLADPLIMGGHSKIYANAFIRYMTTLPPPRVLPVGYVVKHMLKARIRRALSRQPLTVLETHALDGMHLALANYRDSLVEELDDHKLELSVPEEVALQGIINYLHFAADWTGDDLPTDTSGLANEIFGKPVKVDSSTFQYLAEHRILRPPNSDPNDTDAIYRVKDLSSQIADLRPNVIPSYDASFFPDELEKELALADLIANDIFYSLDVSEMMEDDEDDDEEDSSVSTAANDNNFEENEDFDNDDEDEHHGSHSADNAGSQYHDDFVVSYEHDMDDLEEVDVNSDAYKFFDKMRNAGFSRALVDCTFNDMSQSMRTLYPEARLEYAEDVFDGISEDSFVQDCLSVDKKTLSVKHIAVDDSNFPDDEGGISVGMAAKTKDQ